MYIQSIKKHLKARTPQALEREMLRNNIARNKFHHYDIVFDGAYWYAWFLDDKTDPMQAAKELNDATNN